MARLYPDIEIIKSGRLKPEPGELFLLQFFNNNFDESYEVFFQPFLNGDRPDIILMRQGYGVMIIEVKDWNLNHYYLDDKRKWRLKLNNAFLKSPVDQVLQYKDNLYNLHIENLLEKKIKNFKYWSLVTCAVYFHNANSTEIEDLLLNPYKDNKKYSDFFKWNIDLIGKNNVQTEYFTTIFRKRYIISNIPSKLFDTGLYDSFKRYFQPTFHSKEEGIEIKFTDQQKRLSQSVINAEQRVKGVVGSGKTTVLAARAVNAHKRHEERVLILCYNMTLKNYIHDKISRVREDFSWDKFYINNYHNFLSSEMNNCGLEFKIPPNFEDFTQEEKSNFFETNYFSNVELFAEHKNNLSKYKTILIDEIQDYHRPWMDLIKENFLSEDGEYVLWGDEKQNIYDNELEEKDLKTNVKGRPSELKDSFRSVKKIKDLAIKFQQQNFTTKYVIDNFNELPQLLLDYDNPSTINYLYFENENQIEITKLYELISDYSVKLKEHPNDITVLGFRISVLREFECYYRYKSKERTNTMFETQEVWYKLFLQTFKSLDIIKNGLSLIQSNDNDDEKKNKISVLLALRDLVRETNDKSFEERLSYYFEKYFVPKNQFEEWYASNDLADLLNTDKRHSIRKLEQIYPQYRQLTKSLKQVRDNKKHHFWYDRGTLKLSTIHSFKGWEANTLFLILEEQFDGSDFMTSFEELIYTAITRSKTNLVVLNYGYTKHHQSMVDLFDKYNKGIS
ncbi:MAG: NERD domain-containing protein [Flavobacterium sp.]